MAKIILGSYMVRYPLGGMMSWALQYLVGMRDLGHEVYFVEKYGYPDSCFNPVQNVMSNDCSYGLRIMSDLLEYVGLGGRWCFVAYGNQYHGMSRKKVEEIFRTADLFIDMSTHGNRQLIDDWGEESEYAAMRVLIDGEPAYTQIKMASNITAGEGLPHYDHYYTNGLNIGTDRSPAPDVGIKWRHLLHPVSTRLFSPTPSAANSAFSTVMNWQSHAPIVFEGKSYGQKDIEFQKFMALPQAVSSPMEIAVSGKNLPLQALHDHGWRVIQGAQATLSFDSFRAYIAGSRGEFSVCKNIFVENRTGWFSDRSSAYLASGRPVVLQDTGFSEHLPCGEGLFAVQTLEEAAAAITAIQKNHARHAWVARQIACQYLSADQIMKKFLYELGINS